MDAKKHSINSTININEFKTLLKKTEDKIEYIDGIVYMSPPASDKHMAIEGEIYFQLRNQLKDLPCEPLQESKYELKDKYLIPDIKIKCNDNENIKLIVEIVSESSIQNDYFKKSLIYMQNKVEEYWIVDPIKYKVMKYCFGNENEINLEYFDRNDILKSSVFPNLIIDFGIVFNYGDKF